MTVSLPHCSRVPAWTLILRYSAEGTKAGVWRAGFGAAPRARQTGPQGLKPRGTRRSGGTRRHTSNGHDMSCPYNSCPWPR